MENLNVVGKMNPAAVYFVFDHVGKKILGSEYHFKKAGIPGSMQYEALMERMAAQPSYKLSPIPAKKKVARKQTYAGLTLALMEKYIAIQENSEKLSAEFAQMKADKARYPAIKSWFLDAFPGFDVKRSEAEIREHNLNTYKAVIRRVQPKVLKALEKAKAANE